MNGAIKLDFPLFTELMTTVRLTTGGVCSAAGLSLDDGEDCKVCVTESLLLLMHRGFSRVEISFETEDGLGVVIEGKDKTGEESSPAEDEISAALLMALTGNAVMEKREGGLYKVCFRFGA